MKMIINKKAYKVNATRSSPSQLSPSKRLPPLNFHYVSNHIFVVPLQMFGEEVKKVWRGEATHGIYLGCLGFASVTCAV